jgi:hypothetical protein
LRSAGREGILPNRKEEKGKKEKKKKKTKKKKKNREWESMRE